MKSYCTANEEHYGETCESCGACYSCCTCPASESRKANMEKRAVKIHARSEAARMSLGDVVAQVKAAYPTVSIRADNTRKYGICVKIGFMGRTIVGEDRATLENLLAAAKTELGRTAAIAA